MCKSLIICLVILCAFGCKTPEARTPESVKSGSFIDESIQRNKQLYASEKIEIEALIAKSSQLKYTTSKNGFWYAYTNKIEIDSLKTPVFGDIVNFSHSISDLKGDIIYTKEETKTRDYAMDKQELFTGLREGLKLLKSGESATFIFPSQKAYGYYGDENKIGTNIPILCEVTVHLINKK